MSSVSELSESSDSETPPPDFTQRGDLLSVRPGPPPLRVHHFLVVTAVAAVLLSIVAGLRHSESLPLVSFYRSGFGVVYTITSAIGSTLLFYGIWWRLAGRTFFDQPGHWLLVERSLAILTILFAGIVALGGWTTEYSLFGLWSLVMILILCGVNLWAAFRVADTWWWRLVFLLTGVMSLVMPWLPAFVAITTIPAVATMNAAASVVLLLTAAVTDRLAGRPRDWPHWVGIVLRLSMTAGVLLSYAWQWLFTLRGGM